MIRLLAFLAVVFLLGLGFAWLADRPGDMVVTLDGYQYQVSLMAAAALLTALVAAVMVLWWLVKSIWTSPYAISRHFRARRRDRALQDRVIAGTLVTTEAALAKLTATEADTRALTIGTVPLPRRLETRHMAMIGTTGSEL